jgi:hypothetical protein
VAELLRCPRNPVAVWRLLRARAAELGLIECYFSLWLLLRALASSQHREDSCVRYPLMDRNAHFVSSRRSTLENILPAWLLHGLWPSHRHPYLGRMVGWPTGRSELTTTHAAVPPGMNCCPTPKAFRPVMPDKLDKWYSFFTRLSAHHSFPNICLATHGCPEMTALLPGTHPATMLHNTLRTRGAQVLFAPDTPAQDLETAALSMAATALPY